MSKPGVNEFYDINKYPSGYGMEVLGISIPYITTKQRPEACFEMDMHFLENKVNESSVGAYIVYSDGLYMNSSEEAGNLHRKHQKLVEDHKKGYQNLIKKNKWVIPSAFTFTTWNQHILECPDFSIFRKQMRDFYESDKLFQSYVAKDIEQAGREVTENSIAYILEEVLIDFLTAKGKVRLQNEYIKERHTWILNIYHGKPHRSHVYFHQKNPLGIKNPVNKYEDAWYDAENSLLYEFDRLDIDTFNFE